MVITSDAFRFVLTEQLAASGIAAAARLIEPEPRNTAPAVLSAAPWLARQDPDAVKLVPPSNHVIPEPEGFRAAVAAAVNAGAELGHWAMRSRPSGPWNEDAGKRVSGQ